MLRQLYSRARPSLLRPVAHHRQFRSRPQLNFPNYAPPPGPYFSPPPRPPGSRLKDVAFGSVLTVVAYLAYRAYCLQKFAKGFKEAVEKYKQEEAMSDEMRLSMADARRTGDHDRLRELAFQRARYISSGWAEFGPLPGFPGGGNIIPEEDTLMFIWYSSEADNNLIGNDVFLIRIVINAELDEEFLPSKDPKEGAALTELLARVNFLTTRLVREGVMDEGTELALDVFLRDRNFGMLYNINLPAPENGTEDAA
ncbi:hypothetical protein F4814DRAFT_72552 [Daldinia grandis]|nr:hypothetical protein F4814DRAFT_72552 [Daldinia grandis]